MARIPMLPFAALLAVAALSVSIPGSAVAQSAGSPKTGGVVPSKPTAPTHPVAHTTVLPLTEGSHLWSAASTQFWTPGAADLRKLEADTPKSVSTYYCQYLGIVKDGKRLIFINGFSESVASEFIGGKYDWHTHAVQVMDGGQGFFHATYDPKTRQFAGPVYNGVG